MSPLLHMFHSVVVPLCNLGIISHMILANICYPSMHDILCFLGMLRVVWFPSGVNTIVKSKRQFQ